MFLYSAMALYSGCMQDFNPPHPTPHPFLHTQFNVPLGKSLLKHKCIFWLAQSVYIQDAYRRACWALQEVYGFIIQLTNWNSHKSILFGVHTSCLQIVYRGKEAAKRKKKNCLSSLC